MKLSRFDTSKGEMIAIADDQALYLLEFTSSKTVARKIKQLTALHKQPIPDGITEPIISIQKEIALYFEGKLTQFSTPFHLTGTSFQRSVWQHLIQIPYGTTSTYSLIAQAIGNSLASRAVANANAANRLAIIIPCHRVINNDGGLGGYAGGIETKQSLLNLEKQYSHTL